MNYIVVIDPQIRNKQGWIFPIIEKSNLIIKANETMTKNAHKQAEKWMKSEDGLNFFRKNIIINRVKLIWKE